MTTVEQKLGELTQTGFAGFIADIGGGYTADTQLLSVGWPPGGWDGSGLDRPRLGAVRIRMHTGLDGQLRADGCHYPASVQRQASGP